LNTRKKKNFENENKTEEEMEELRKFRMQEMYRKIGYVRLYMCAILGATMMSGYIILQKYRRTSISGGVLYSQVLRFLQRNDLVTKALGKNMRFVDQIRGAVVDEEAEFKIDAFGDKNSAIFNIKAKYNRKLQEWNLIAVDMLLKDGKGKELSRKKLI